VSEAWPWVALVVLGAYHGINPGMGWLFAVARGLQEKRRSVVVQSLLPIAVGHEASVALVVILVSGLEMVTAANVLRPLGAAALILFGVYKVARPRSHPRWVGYKISMPELSLWSFLMSTAHGAGLMLFPILLGLPAAPADIDLPGVGLSTALVLEDVAAVFVHTAAMLAVMGAVALVVYDRLGLSVLRRAWVNLDLVWAGAVIAAGVVTLFT
jgi:hypothetical protein